MYQQSVPALISKNIGNVLTNYNAWGDIIINVKADPYFAKGDGVKDDTAALQSAINYAISVGKKEIFVPTGTYLYGVLTNSSGLTFIGDGVTMNGTTKITLTSLAALKADNAQRGINVCSAPYNAKGDGVTDDTAAILAASMDAKINGTTLFFPPLNFVLKDTITVNYGNNKCHWIGHGATITFDNSVANKPLFNLTPQSTHSTFEGIVFVDKNSYTSKAVRISAYPYTTTMGLGPNWKNMFIHCQFILFKTGVHFTTDGDPLVGTAQDFASENMFLHCKFKNCQLSVLNDNLQALNNNFISTDIENDAASEQFTMIRDNAGGGMNFIGCSLIGRGHVFEWYVDPASTNLFPHAILNMTQCRFEVRSTHIGQIFFQVPGGDYSKFSNQNIHVTDCSFIMFSQTVDLIQYTGRVTAIFTNIDVDYNKVIIRNHPVSGKSSSDGNGSFGCVIVTRSSNVEYVLDTTATYGATDRHYAAKVDISHVVPDSASTMFADSYGFYRHHLGSHQQPGLGLNDISPKRLSWNDASETWGFNSLKLILPNWARMTKFGIWKQPVRFTIDTPFELYIVKDAAAWATPGTFNYATDAYLVASTGTTINKAGLFEVPIQLTSNSLGYRMEAGFGTNWTVGRIYIRYSGGSSFGGFVYVEYI